MEELNKEQIEEIKSKLNDQEWRLSHLYWITDVSGKKILFKLNAVQMILYKNLWFRNLVNKSRQHGITTFITIYFLDSVLFNSNQKAIILAHTQADSRKIFDNKVKYAFDNLPKYLRDQFAVDTNNANILKFNTNGSSIEVSTSARSGTYQYIHVSEFGILCARYPEKAREVITGTLNTAHPGKSVIIIESTSRGRYGYWFDLCMEAMVMKKLGKELTQLDFKFFFFGWTGNELNQLEGNVPIPTSMEEYFTSLKEKEGITLTQAQKSWYVKTAESQGDDMWSEFPSTPEEAFKASVEGAYYTKQLNRMYADKRITHVPHDASIPVGTFWDIGVGDTTNIIFVQFAGLQIRIIDEYEASGEGLQHYARILQEKAMKNNYVYGTHYAPFDIEVRELGSNAKTRREIARGLGLIFKVVKKHDLGVGIDKTRTMLNAVWIDEEKCSRTLAALQGYRKEFDEKLGTWGSKPLHSWESHFADSIRQLAMTYESIIGHVVTGNPGKMKDDDDLPVVSGKFDVHAPLGGNF